MTSSGGAVALRKVDGARRGRPSGRHGSDDAPRSRAGSRTGAVRLRPSERTGCGASAVPHRGRPRSGSARWSREGRPLRRPSTAGSCPSILRSRTRSSRFRRRQGRRRRSPRRCSATPACGSAPRVQEQPSEHRGRARRSNWRRPIHRRSRRRSAPRRRPRSPGIAIGIACVGPLARLGPGRALRSPPRSKASNRRGEHRSVPGRSSWPIDEPPSPGVVVRVTGRRHPPLGVEPGEQGVGDGP